MQSKNRIFLGISTFQALTMFRRGLFYSYLSIYLRYYLGLSVTETTLFATLPMILNVVFQMFVWGVLSDKYQKRRTLIILGEISAALSTFIVWLIHTFPDSRIAAGYVIIIGLAFVEIFWSMSNVGWTAIISDFYPEESRTSIQGRLAVVGGIGRIIGVWIGGIAYDGLSRFYEGWGFDKGILFFIASGIMLLSTIPMFFMPEGGIGKSPESKSLGPSIITDPGLFRSLTRPFIVFLVAMIFVNFGRNSIAVIKTQYLVMDQGFNVSSSLLSYIVNMQSLATLISGIWLSRFAKKFNEKVLLYLGAIAAMFYLFGYAFGRGLVIIFGSDFLAGVAEVIIFSSSYTYASKLIPPEHRGKHFALFNATYFLSWGVAGTLIAGPVVDLMIRSGASELMSYQMAFVSAAVLVLFGVLMLGFAYRTNQHYELRTKN